MEGLGETEELGLLGRNWGAAQMAAPISTAIVNRASAIFRGKCFCFVVVSVGVGSTAVSMGTRPVSITSLDM